MSNKNIEDVYPASPIQEGLLFHSLYSDESGVYVTQFACLLKGLHLPSFELAWQRVVDRHQILRTAFVWKTVEKTLQVVGRRVKLSIQQEDWRGLTPLKQQEQFEAFLQDDRQRGFDVSKAPLMRLALLQMSDEAYQFVWSHHHLLLDGWSASNLLKEVFVTYEAAVRGTEINSPRPRPYRDYIAWQLRQDIKAAETFWRRLLSGFSAPTQLSIARSTPSTASTAHSTYSERRRHLSPASTAELHEMARHTQLTLNTLVQGAWAILLSRYSGESDVVFGATVSGRPAELSGVEEMVGLFINTLPVRAQLKEEKKVVEWLRELQEQQVEMREYEYSPLVQVQGWSEVGRGVSLFETIVVFENYPVDAMLREHQGSVEVSHIRNVEQTNYPLTLAVMPGPELILQLAYDRARFDDTMTERMLVHLERLLLQIAAEPERQLGSVSLLSAAERHQLLIEWNKTAAAEIRNDVCIHEVFEAQVKRTPEAVALVHEEERLTYGELNRRANQLARQLKLLGVEAEMRVGVCIERSVEMVIGLLGILKAGGTYVPLDPSYPQERLQFMVEDAEVAVLLTQSTLSHALPPQPPHVQTIYLDTAREELAQQAAENLSSRVLPGNLAYIIYTSGSTGTPKGVCVTHEVAVNHFDAIRQTFRLEASDHILQFASLSFDVSLEQILPTLLIGARSILRGDQLWSAADFIKKLEDEKLTVINFPTSYWHQLTQEAINNASLDSLHDLKLTIIGGDVILPEAARLWQNTPLGAARLLNAYGPTETVITAATFEIPSESHNGSSQHNIPIGRPVEHRAMYILDSNGEPVPVGIAGELHIGGPLLARGYFKRPDLTAEKFVPDPFGDQPGGRLYRTGDLVRYLPDSNIEFLGRVDNQVKVRGFRIELGEIESVLAQHEEIREVAVVVREEMAGDKRLVAYVVPGAKNELSQTSLRSFLQEKLPAYMQPSGFVFLEKLPLTPNGKVDRRALPAPDLSLASDSAYVAPRDDVEATLAKIWTEVIGLGSVGVHDDFFEVGGDSILSLQIVSKARRAGLLLMPKQIFEYPTIAQLATIVGTTEDMQQEQGAVTGSVPLTPIQHHFFERNLDDPHHFNQSVLLEAQQPLETTILKQAVQHLLRHHDALRMRFMRRQPVWEQVNPAPDEKDFFTTIDLTHLPAEQQKSSIEAKAREIQASLNLSEGPLLRVALFDLGAPQPSRLLFVIHHLVIDGVSWRILLEDLQKLYWQLSRGDKPELPPKTTSFKRWSEQLNEYARSTALREELSYWLGEPEHKIARLPVDHNGGANTEAAARSVTISLSAEETRALLQEVPRAYQTQINDVLLMALAQIMARWTEQQTVLIDLEGHGREELFPQTDLSRTVGWFTSLFPVRLQVSESATTRETLKSIKEQLRALPQHGIGYGLLRYLSGDAEIAARLRELPQAELVFNYLGQLDQTLGDFSMFRPAKESSGPDHSPRQKREHLLEVNASVMEGQLRIFWSYSEQVHERATVERLAKEYGEQLRQLIMHCLSAEAGGYTPSDFPLVNLDQQTLDLLIENQPQLEDIAPLSPTQQGILFHTLMSPEAGEYVGQIVWTLHGEINIPALEQSWQQMVDRHPILRTAFVEGFIEEPLQAVRRKSKLPIIQQDWRDIPIAEQEERFKSFLEEDQRRGFDVGDPPLMRLTLIRMAEDAYKFVWSHHHLLLDGWSASTLIKEALLSYEALTHGEQVQLARPRPYRDYIAWQLRQDISAAEAFWRRFLKGFSAPTALSLARSTASTADSTYSERRRRLSPASTAELHEMARHTQLTLNTLVQGAWAILLSRYSGESDVVFGATVSGRPAELSGVEEMVGLFINTLPVRAQLSEKARVVEWLRSLQEQQVEMREYEYSPLVQVQGWSEVGRGVSLFETIVVFENYPVDTMLREHQSTLQISDVRSLGRSSYPLSLVVEPDRNGMLLRGIYDEQSFEAEAIERMLGHLETLLKEVTINLEQRLSDLTLLNEDERQQILVEWNDTATDYPRHHCVHKMFEAQAQRTPEATALVFDDQQLSYAELNQRANQLAHHLHTLGVGAETLVGICVERSLEMVVGLLGILKAGGAYVPLDPDYPQERLSFMLEDAAVKVLLTQERLSERLPTDEALLVRLDADWEEISRHRTGNPESRVSAENVAYVIYTSGSTGQPKGISIVHYSINRLVFNTNYVDIKPSERIVQVSNSSFDAATFEIWGALLTGATLVGISKDVFLSTEDFARQLREQNITTLFLTTALFNQHASQVPSIFKSLRQVLFGGEAVDPRWVREVLTHGAPERLLHVYGPTESTTYASWYLVTDVPEGVSTIPIGRPLANTEIYVLHKNMQPVPVGVPGELYIGGDGLARGYLNRSALTAERFVPHPFSHALGERLYRTGDLVRLLADGAIEFIGRVDNQVKIRGFRIELGEIEEVLRRHAEVHDAVVLAREETIGERRLVAYVVLEDTALSGVNDLRHYMEETLPQYMVPQAFVLMDELPLTPNGKVDRQALPVPGFTSAGLEETFIAPRNAAEEKLAGIFQDVLEVERVGVHDDFFELGGHSLLATRAVSRVRETFDVELPLRSFFETPTVAGIGALLESSSQEDDALQPPPIRRRTRETELPLSFAQQRLWFLDQFQPDTAIYNIPLAISLSGKLGVEALRQALNEIVRRHEVLRTHFPAKAGEPVQQIASEFNLPLPVIDLSELPTTQRENEMQRLIEEEARRSFDLSRGPLLRVQLLRLTESEHIALLVMHHIISDGWSMGVLVREVGALYAAYSAGEESPLEELEVQYADFSVWQREWLKDEVLEGQLNYWKQQLAGSEKTILQLPTDRPRSESREFRGAYVPIDLPKDLLEGFKTLSGRQDATLFMILLASFQALLSHLTGQQAISVGTDIANRNRHETENLIGFFINQLVLRTDLSANPSFTELLGRVREVTLSAYAHQDVPFELLVDALKPERSLKYAPLFQVKLVLQNTPQGALDLPGLTLSLRKVGYVAAKFDLTLILSETPDGLTGNFEYDTDLFDESTISRIAKLYVALLGKVITEPDIRLEELKEYLAEIERKQQAMEKTEREGRQRQKLMGIKPKKLRAAQESLVKKEFRHPDETFPLVVKPLSEETDLVGWVKSNRQAVESDLQKHGALLFRGFGIDLMTEFEFFAGALCTELFDENGEHPRNVVSGKVYTPVFYPADQHLLWHNENSFNYRWPTKIFFACMLPAQHGGETPIADSRQVFERIDPKIRERFIQKGVMYVRNYDAALGLDWQTVFQTTDKSQVESSCRAAGLEFKWKDNGQLRTRAVRPAVIPHPVTGEMSWFNQAQHWHVSCLDPATRESIVSVFREEDYPRHCYYGDGSPIPDDAMMEILDVYRGIEVSFTWQAKDIMMLDNILMAHARNQFSGERKLLVAMGDMMSFADIEARRAALA